MASINVASELVKAICNKMYPVGSIYISTTSTNPSTYLGGTWSRVSNGRCLLGVDESNSDTNMKTANVNGGWPTHNHTTGNHTLTINEVPAHSHNFGNRLCVWDAGVNGSNAASGNYGATPIQFYGWDNVPNTSNTGGGASHNHGNTGNGTSYPPFYSCYIWRRTA